MSNTEFNHTNKPDGSPSDIERLLSYALLHCDPMREPPFNVELGFSDGSVRTISECAHIPEAIEKLEALCQQDSIVKAASFTLIYPIYLEAMGTDEEDTMHNIAWIIKEQADMHGWQFGRIGGYTGKTVADFVTI